MWFSLSHPFLQIPEPITYVAMFKSIAGKIMSHLFWMNKAWSILIRLYSVVNSFISWFELLIFSHCCRELKGLEWYLKWRKTNLVYYQSAWWILYSCTCPSRMWLELVSCQASGDRGWLDFPNSYLMISALQVLSAQSSKWELGKIINSVLFLRWGPILKFMISHKQFYAHNRRSHWITNL